LASGSRATKQALLVYARVAAALEQLLLKLGALAEAVPRISEIDLNPVLVHPAGEGVSLIDARVRLV
jgi:hypothetical protein